MKYILPAVLSFLLLTAFHYQNKWAGKPKLTCTISTDRTVYKPGEVPQIRVNIVNEGNEDVYLVGSLDGSDIKRRMPYCYFTIITPTAYEPEMAMRCGNTNPLRAKDFKLIKPGQSFDPYERIDGYGFFSSHEITNKKTFINPGTYKIRFHYSTRSNELAEYLGSPEYRKDLKDSIKVATCFAGLPKIDLASNTIEIKIES